MAILLFARRRCATLVGVWATLLDFSRSVLRRETLCDCHRGSGDSLPPPIFDPAVSPFVDRVDCSVRQLLWRWDWVRSLPSLRAPG